MGAKSLIALFREGQVICSQGDASKEVFYIENGVLPNVSQETLAEMIGTTRSRVNIFMNKFRKLGFIRYNGEIEINTSLLSVVLHD
jgi:CRP-like cAMP-binding protein